MNENIADLLADILGAATKENGGLQKIKAEAFTELNKEREVLTQKYGVCFTLFADELEKKIVDSFGIIPQELARINRPIDILDFIALAFKSYFDVHLNYYRFFRDSRVGLLEREEAKSGDAVQNN